MRARCDAIVIGAGTARADDPRLTVRVPRVRLQPLRVVCDTRLELPLGLRLFRAPLARGTVVACGVRSSAARRRALEARGVTVWPLAERQGGVAPRALARRLAEEGCHDVLLEAGATLGTAWLRSDLVDQFALFIAPLLLGEGRTWLGPLGKRGLAGARRVRLARQERVGDDALLIAEV